MHTCAQLVFHFLIEELAVSHEVTLRNCCVRDRILSGFPAPLVPPPMTAAVFQGSALWSMENV